MPKRSWFRLSSLGLFFLLPLLLGGCAYDTVQSALDPQGPIASQQISLFTYTMWLSVIVLVGVGGVMLWAILRFRAKPDDDSIPVQNHGNTAVEIGLILLATVLTVIVVVPAVRTIFKTEYRVVPTEEDIVVKVTGYQWWWAIEYPELGIVTANEVHVPKGKRVVFELNSADVLHSFWVPKLAGKRDLIPNQKNQLWFVTDENTPTGVYSGQCAELCLGAHAYMRFRVVVDTEEDFAAWVDSFQSIEPLSDSTASTGAQLPFHSSKLRDKSCCALQARCNL